MPLRPKRWLTGIKIGTHGGIDRAELESLGIDPAKVLDFSVCTNPYLPPGLREMLDSTPVGQYPDSDAIELRQALSSNIGVPAENILAGSGTTELLRFIATAYLRRGDAVLMLEPTYGDYAVAARLAGVRPLSYRASKDDGFTPRVDEVITLVRKQHPRAVFICNPNNPTGKYLPRRDIEAMLDAIGGDSLLILDEAYVAFVENSWNALDLIARDNVIILRSMTKDYGIPGLRLGYAVADREIINTLRRLCPPWSINIVAQKVGVSVLQDKDYLKQSLLKIRQAKQYLIGEFSRLGFEVMPSDAHYFLVKVGNARQFRDALLKHGMLVRDCSSFGLPEYIRLSPRNPPECERLIAAMKTIQQRESTNGSIFPDSQ